MNMTIAFDCDGTLTTDYGPNPKPRYEVIDLYQWFIRNGDRVIVWSGGGAEYAADWCRRLGLNPYATLGKTKENAKAYDVDIAVDDELVNLGKVNIHV